MQSQQLHKFPAKEYDNNVGLTLLNADEWKSFSSTSMEMIVNWAGQKILPRISLGFHGLFPNLRYKISVDFRRADGYKWFYSCHGWARARHERERNGLSGKIIHVHGGKALNGSEWMEYGCNFDKFILTNNSELKQDNTVFVQPMHAYVPWVMIEHVRRCQDGVFRCMTVQNIPLHATRFIAVTKYQNFEMRELMLAKQRKRRVPTSMEIYRMASMSPEEYESAMAEFWPPPDEQRTRHLPDPSTSRYHVSEQRRIPVTRTLRSPSPQSPMPEAALPPLDQGPVSSPSPLPQHSEDRNSPPPAPSFARPNSFPASSPSTPRPLDPNPESTLVPLDTSLLLSLDPPEESPHEPISAFQAFVDDVEFDRPFEFVDLPPQEDGLPPYFHPAHFIDYLAQIDCSIMY